MKPPIYLDHQATTPCDPRVVDAMAPYWTREFGNPASRTHAFGWRAEEAVEQARAAVARLVGARAREIVFTSGATESNNLAILGVARALRPQGDHVVTCVTEHNAVLDPCRALEREGFRVTRVAVDPAGLVRLDQLRSALDPRTVLVSIMHANNEIGVIQPLEEISRITRERGVLLHTDAAQSVGKISVQVDRLGVDLLSLSGHKIYGPKGIGALYVRRRRPGLRIEPVLFGGGHERGLRSGTLPVPLCVGLGNACRLAARESAADAVRIAALRDRLHERLSRELEEVWLNGHPERRIPGNLNLSFLGIEAQALLVSLPGIAFSSGSACTSSTPGPSHVLRGLGVGEGRAISAVRYGIGRTNREDEIETAAELTIRQVRRLRAASPAWRRLRARAPAGAPGRRTVPAGADPPRRPAPKAARMSYAPGRISTAGGAEMTPKPKSEHITWSHSQVTRAEREKALGHRAATVWFTGLSGSGKSTIAIEVERELVRSGVSAYVLDGDNIRHGLNANLGFSPEDRTENIRRIGEVAKLFNDAGVVVLTAFISPYRADRDRVRGILPDGGFVEVLVDCPLDVCEERDVKGLYRKARAGEIPEFTGISAPYEPPTDPELVLRSAEQDVDACVEAVLACLREKGVIG